MKKIFLILALTLIIQCGYKPIYLNEKTDFKINNIEINSKNRIIERRLKSIESKNPEFYYNLKINFAETKSTLSKNKKGKPTLLRMQINLDMQVFENNNLIMEKKYTNNFDYQNLDKKFELNDYESQIRKDMFNEIANKISLDLIKLK